MTAEAGERSSGKTHRDEEAPTELAHDHTLLVTAASVDRDDSCIRPTLGKPLRNNRALAVNGVAVEDRREMLERFGSECCDRLPGGVRNRDPEEKRVDQCSNDHVPADVHLGARVLGVSVYRTDRTGQ